MLNATNMGSSKHSGIKLPCVSNKRMSNALVLVAPVVENVIIQLPCLLPHSSPVLNLRYLSPVFAQNAYIITSPADMCTMQATKYRLPNRPGQKRCWNCPDRKIACDRSLPSCSNCRERRETCRGYGLKLSWPRDNDSRRLVRQSNHFLYPVQYKELDFINTSTEAIEALQNSPWHFL
ncbi:hypothetical protein BR93DRAFT_693358 [Coniochaeta sp. PMI_546]|nr:hypothetical protein BR93DRAFT_693358 [Coniochaeta sp. PMI_546]